MKNKEIAATTIELRDLLFLYDAKGLLMDNGESYLYKTYFDSNNSCSVILISKEAKPLEINIIKFPYNLNEYDTKVSAGLQHRVIELVVREFIHKERMKLIKQDIDQKTLDLRELRKSNYFKKNETRPGLSGLFKKLSNLLRR